MTPEQFCYWLQGFIEIASDDLKNIDEKRIQIIKDHLDLVFHKVTPDRRQVLTEEIEKAKAVKKKRTAALDEVVDEIQRQRRSDVYCDPFDPHTTRIC